MSNWGREVGGVCNGGHCWLVYGRGRLPSLGQWNGIWCGCTYPNNSKTRLDHEGNGRIDEMATLLTC